jgi:hypothetical protein
VASTRDQAVDAAEHDVFVCCPDADRREACETLVAYLARAGFRVFFEPSAGPTGPALRLALVRKASDFILFLPAPGSSALETGSQPHGEVLAALESGRNTLRVSLAGEPAFAPGSRPSDLDALATCQSAVYDPDRLAESLSVIQHCLSTDTIVTERHMMRRTRRYFVFAAGLLLAGFSAQAVPGLIREWRRPKPPAPVPPFVLHWTAFGERDNGGVLEELPLPAGAGVRGGDRLRVSFSTSADGFAYVIGKDLRGRVWVLFPSGSLKGASRVRAGRTYHAPADAAWLTVDADAGLETIYVFAGYDPLQNLEELIEEPESGNDAGERRGLVDQTVAGLLDGRHHPVGPRVWIRTTALVDQGLEAAPGPQAFTARLGNGGTASHRATVQPGLVNALAEITVAFSR